MTAAPFLREVPLLEGVPAAMLERLAAGARLVDVPAGAWLLREGEDAESAFVVSAGRLEVVSEGPPERTIAVLRRGDVFGELALLGGGRRAASVRAQRDTEVLELGRRDFERLVEETPSFALGLARTLGAQLAAGLRETSRPSLPRTVAVVALDEDAPAADTADRLADALRRHGTVVRLAAGEHEERGAMRAALDRAEADADRVVLAAAGSHDDLWNAFCLREADLVVAVTRGAPGAGWRDRPAVLHGCELLVAGASVSEETVRALVPREVHVVGTDGERRHAIDALARRLAGRAIGVVLSGGGARAFAHLGVLEVLEEHGITIDRLGGASLGALVAAARATGMGPEDAYRGFERTFVQTNPSNDFTWPAYSLVRGAKTRRRLLEEFGDSRIEALPKRYYCTSSDLLARESVVHRFGPVREAVYASMALPGVFPPVRTADGRLLVDGGVLDNLPVAEMARPNEGPVIAVDVTGRLRQAGRPSRPGITRLGRPVRRFLTGSEAQIPRLGETVMRTVTAGSRDSVAAAKAHADLVILPAVDSIGLMEFGRLAEARETGRSAARRALALLPDGIIT